LGEPEIAVGSDEEVNFIISKEAPAWRIGLLDEISK
jgi:hypothetical protein